MDKKDNNMSAEYYTIDLLHIVKRVWHYIWAVALASLLAAVIGFCCASFLIAPTYSSSVMLYVNNTSLSLGGADFTISSSQISAAQSLVDTYSVILKSRTTLELVKEKSDYIVSIPMYGKVNSFNVSTAAAIILAEASKQHREC